MKCDNAQSSATNAPFADGIRNSAQKNEANMLLRSTIAEMLQNGESRLPNGVIPDAMRFGVRATRNELMKDTMRDYGYIESIGLGVPRQIIRGMREHNGTNPDLISEETRFILRLYR